MAAPQPTPLPTWTRFAAHAWWLVLLGALAFLGWTNHVRIKRVEYLTGMSGWSVAVPAADPQSATGYAGGQRRLIVPQHHSASYAWISQTQLMIARGDWRMRHLDYENAPIGRASSATAPYRWWLAFVGWLNHSFSDRSLPQAIEHGALYADPVLHAVLLVSLVCFVASRFGSAAAGVAAVSAVGLFPLAGNFQPGAPDHHSLVWLLAIWSALPLLAASPGSDFPGIAPAPARRPFSRGRVWPMVAGLAGGCALWVDAISAVPVIAGIGSGALVAVATEPRTGNVSAEVVSRWRTWAVAGAVTTIVAYAAEYFPNHLEWAVPSVHVWHAVAWLGLGELVVRVASWRQLGAGAWTRATVVIAAAALAGVLALPTVMLSTASGGLLAADPLASELANVPNAPLAPGFGAWITRDGFTSPLLAVLAPALLLAVAVGRATQGRIPPAHRRALLVALAPALFALVLGWFQLRWWNLVNAMTLIVIVALFAAMVQPGRLSPQRWFLILGCVLLIAPGFRQIVPGAGTRAGDPLSQVEVQDVLERDLAHWLALRNEGGSDIVLFSTPAVTEALAYYGSIKGVASFSPENKDGFSAAVRIASSSTLSEAQALAGNRQVTHFVLPAWDPVLEEYVRLGRRVPPGSPIPRDSFVANLARWNLPPWLKPLAYPVPPNPGFENNRVTVFALQPEQDDVLNVCQLAEYFLETNQHERAGAMREQLELYPRDLGALTMLGQVHFALGDTASFQKTLEAVLPHLSRRSARTLPLDRRVNLAALLANARQTEAAGEQVRQCLAGIDAERLRELSPGSLVRLVALSNLFKIEFPDPALRSLALSLVPPVLQARLAPGAAAHP